MGNREDVSALLEIPSRNYERARVADDRRAASQNDHA
jgi:hypothetical protein